METILLFLLLSGCGNDFLDAMPSSGYWKMHDVQVTATAMMKELDDSQATDKEEPRAYIQALITQLGASREADRDAAEKELLLLGREAYPEIAEAAKRNDSSEIAARAAGILDNIDNRSYAETWRWRMVPRDRDQARAVRRLMAIRTIGENKYKEAMPLLLKLTESKVPYEADYARRAIARIEGRKLTLEQEPFDMKLRERDLAALPREIGGVAQFIQLPQMELGVPEMKIDTQYSIFGNSRIRYQMWCMVSMTAGWGNMRLQHATVFVPENFGDENDSWIGLILRCSYDYKAVKQIFKDCGVTFKKIGEAEVGTFRDGMVMAPVSDSLLVMFVCPGRNAKPPIESVIKALVSGGKGGIEKNVEIQDLLEQVDRTKDYAVLLPGKAMERFSINRITLEVVRGQHQQQWRLTARPVNAGWLAAEAWKGYMLDLKQDSPAALAPFVELLDKVDFSFDGNTFTVELKGDVIGAIQKTIAAGYTIY